MYEYQRRLLNEAAKHGKLSPKETQNLPEECRDFIVEGVNVMKGAEKLVLNSGLDVGTYRKLLNVLRNRLGGHAMILDITKPTGPGAARGGLTGEGSEIKIVKIADIGKYEFNGYDFKGIKLGNKAERTWKDHKGQAIIIALNESVQEEAEVDEETISEAIPSNIKIRKIKSLTGGAVEYSVEVNGVKHGEFYMGRDYKGTYYTTRVDMNGRPTYDRGGTQIRNRDEMIKNVLDSYAASAAQELAKKKASPNRIEMKGDKVTGVFHNNQKVTNHGVKIDTVQDIRRGAIFDLEDKYNTEFVVVREGYSDSENISESDFQDIAKHNLEVSTKLALKKDKKHDSQWGVGYRGYLRLVVGGRAISKHDVPSGKTGEGWNTARNDIITGKKLNEEVENLEEMTGKEAANILNGVRSVKVVRPVKFANLETGKTYNMSVQGAHVNPSLPGGDKLYVLTSGAKRSGKIISKNLAKAIKAGDLQIVKEETENLDEASIESVANRHMMKIARSTLRANPAMVGVMGGMNVRQAHEFLLRHGTPAEKKAAKDYLSSTKKEEVEGLGEAYAPNWAYAQRKQHPILGQFKYKGNTFEYRAIVKGTSGSDWALSHGMTHEIFLRPVWNDKRDARFAIIKATVAQVAVDEGEGGKPVYEKWPITGHKKYPTESTEIQTNEAVTPNWAKSQAKQHPILGKFKYKNETFEYRAVVKGTPDSDWALKNGLYYEVFMKPMHNDHRDVRFANIKGTDAYIAVDKGDDGKPVLKKLNLTMHQRYPEPKRS